MNKGYIENMFKKSIRKSDIWGGYDAFPTRRVVYSNKLSKVKKTDKTWRKSNGEIVLIPEMSDNHINNCITMLKAGGYEVPDLMLKKYYDGRVSCLAL